MVIPSGFENETRSGETQYSGKWVNVVSKDVCQKHDNLMCAVPPKFMCKFSVSSMFSHALNNLYFLTGGYSLKFIVGRSR